MPDTRTDEEKGIVPIEELRRREAARLKAQKAVGDKAQAASFRETVTKLDKDSGSVLSTKAGSAENINGQDLAGQFGESVDNGEAAQTAMFGKEAGIVRNRTNPLTNQKELTREGAIGTVQLNDIEPNQTIPEALKQMEDFNNAANNTTTPEQAFINRKILSEQLAPGAKWRGADSVKRRKADGSMGTFDTKYLDSRQARLEHFEASQKVGGKTGFARVNNGTGDTASRTGRRRSRGQDRVPVMSSEEFGKAYDKVNNIIENPDSATSLTETEYAGIKHSLAGTGTGQDFLRKRGQKEVEFNESLDIAEKSFNDSDDVEAFMFKYTNDPMIGCYATAEIAEALSNKTIQSKIAQGDRDKAISDARTATENRTIVRALAKEKRDEQRAIDKEDRVQKRKEEDEKRDLDKTLSSEDREQDRVLKKEERDKEDRDEERDKNLEEKKDTEERKLIADKDTATFSENIKNLEKRQLERREIKNNTPELRDYLRSKEFDDDQIKESIDSMLLGDESALILYDKFKAEAEEYFESNGKKMTHVRKGRDDVESMREKKALKRALAHSNSDITDPKFKPIIEDIGGVEAGAAIEGLIKSENGTLEKTYRIDGKQILVARVPENIDYSKLAANAISMSGKDGVSIEIAINTIVNDIEGTNEDGVKFIKVNVANNINPKAKMLIEEKVKEPIRQATIEEAILAEASANTWIEDFEASDAFDSPSFLSSLGEPPDIIAYIIKSMNVSGLQREFIMDGLIAAQGENGIASPEAKNYLSIKRAYDIVKAHSEAAKRLETDAINTQKAAITSAVNLAHSDNPSKKLDEHEVKTILRGGEEVFVYKQVNKDFTEAYYGLPDDDPAKKIIDASNMISKSTSGGIIGANSDLVMPDNMYTLDRPSSIESGAVANEPKLAGLKSEMLNMYRKTKPEEPGQPGSPIRKAINGDVNTFLYAYTNGDKDAQARVILAMNNIAEIDKFSIARDSVDKDKFTIENINDLDGIDSIQTSTEMDKHAVKAIKASIGNSVVQGMLTSDDATLRKQGVMLSLALWDKGNRIQIQVTSDTRKKLENKLAGSYDGATTIDGAIDSLKDLPAARRQSEYDDLANKLTVIRGTLDEMSEEPRGGIIDITAGEEEILGEIYGDIDQQLARLGHPTGQAGVPSLIWEQAREEIFTSTSILGKVVGVPGKRERVSALINIKAHGNLKNKYNEKYKEKGANHGELVLDNMKLQNPNGYQDFVQEEIRLETDKRIAERAKEILSKKGKKAIRFSEKRTAEEEAAKDAKNELENA